MILKPTKPYWNVDSVSKQIMSDAIYDGYRDEFDSVNSRFGLKLFCDLATNLPGDGFFWWDKLDKGLAVSGGRCFEITSSGGAFTELTGGDFLTGTPTVFADGQKVDNSAFLYACNGGKLNYSTSGNFAQAASPAPQTCTHVVYNGLRFLANETDTARFYFTDVDPTTGEFSPTYWAATENPLTSDSRGDNVLGLYQAWDDVSVWGQQGREIWQTTGGTPPLQPRLGGLSETGLLAPYSVRKADNTFFALCVVDGKPAVVRLQANEPIIISLDIEKLLDLHTTLSDAIGDVISVVGQSFYVLTLPTENVTYAYNIKLKEWYIWSLWDLAGASRNAFLGRNFIYAKAWGKHLCQSRIDGKIYEVDQTATDDAGTLIRTEWQTGWLDGGTSNNKAMSMVRLHMKRGTATLATTTAPLVTLKYRDNGAQVWKNERQISLGLTGKYEFYRRINGLGMFRSRQMSIVFSDATKLILADLDIELKKLGN